MFSAPGGHQGPAPSRQQGPRPSLGAVESSSRDIRSCSGGGGVIPVGATATAESGSTAKATHGPLTLNQKLTGPLESRGGRVHQSVHSYWGSKMRAWGLAGSGGMSMTGSLCSTHTPSPASVSSTRTPGISGSHTFFPASPPEKLGVARAWHSLSGQAPHTCESD